MIRDLVPPFCIEGPSEKSRGLSVQNSGRWTVFLVVCTKLSQNFGEWPNTSKTFGYVKMAEK